VIDQAISSGTNFALLFLTVRSVSLTEFGAFSLVYLLYVLTVPVARATGATPFTIRHSADDPATIAAAARKCLDYTLGLGLGLTVVCLAATMFVQGPIRAALLVLAPCFPLLLVQDAIRGILFAQSDLFKAACNDALWATVQFAVLCPLLLSHVDIPVWVFVLAWAGGGAIAAMLGLSQLGVRLRLANPLSWLRQHADLARPLFFSTALTVLPAHLTYLMMPAVSSLSELGSIRGVYVLFGPLNVAFTTASMLALPYAVRLPQERVRLFALRLSLLLAGVSIAWGIAMVALPNALGRSLIGDVWDDTLLVRVLLALSLVAEGVMVGPATALYALRYPDRLAQVRYVTAPLTLMAGLALAALHGAEGVALAFAFGYSLTSLLGWLRVPAAHR